MKVGFKELNASVFENFGSLQKSENEHFTTVKENLGDLNSVTNEIQTLQKSYQSEVLVHLVDISKSASGMHDLEKSRFMNLTNEVFDRMSNTSFMIQQQYDKVDMNLKSISNWLAPAVDKLQVSIKRQGATQRGRAQKQHKEVIKSLDKAKTDLGFIIYNKKYSRSECIPDIPPKMNRVKVDADRPQSRNDPKRNGHGIYGNYFRFANLEYSVTSMKDFFSRILGYSPHRRNVKPMPHNKHYPMRRLKWSTNQIDLSAMTNSTKGLGFLQPTKYEYLNVMFSDGSFRENDNDAAMFSWYTGASNHNDWERSHEPSAKYSIIQEGYGVAIPKYLSDLNAIVWGWSVQRKMWVKLAQVKNTNYQHTVDFGNEWFKDSWDQFWTEGYHVAQGEGKYCTWDFETIDAIGFSVY